ncbi:hypothetical protein PtrSN002B_001989 [Pyrenophora tritici-repentis]|uniref:Uncharacterized protein n=1 Tax=Pyrenophora tritici-repentis TaxID=45151 RepID=A0A2W1DUB8_9PLEO|nr:hypothetical protein A1F99_031040 [Pyrenophora tritici-repentis]KAF7575568.1 hypothetical protein PtrM4_071920 [Pyrenophora tritici-repentis]KAG9385690.1 hypothetical protein A1F94_002440 [Pyrenophora tritici-repentis]KAI0575024.1 hypothetical protein Alg215_08257 [Pyrenophora tritici-repentis]KAI0624465.1 hypothetical protein TUN199_03502 [Pyrenophora tritici-repentis]
MVQFSSISGFALASFIIVVTVTPTPLGLSGEQLYCIRANARKEPWDNRCLSNLNI